MDNQYHYPGSELETFESAINWKKYMAEKIRPFIKGDVMEIGAGLGSSSKILDQGEAHSWTLLEPDAGMYEHLKKNLSGFHAHTKVQQGTVKDVQQQFDTILYIDVLEHIEDDKTELELASNRLNAGGHLVVFSPAFHSLYSEFDRAIGHVRRYDKKKLKQISPNNMKLILMRHLDSVGFFASMMNRLALHQEYPTKNQIRFWDSKLVPVSRITDRFFSSWFGKTILAVWEKQ
ncbi:MAG: class I SAM-dependent methyltransferase [Flavisolibacter sp.]